MKNSICKYNTGMRSLLHHINEVPAGIAFITDEEDKLCGVVTDGDFRRLLLSGRSLDESLRKSDLKPFVSALQGEDIQELIKKTNTKVRLIPIVDEQGKLVDYFRYEHRVHMTPVAEPNLKGNEFNYLCDAFLSTWISSTGEYINRFEKGFSDYCGTKHGIAVSNGTVAIHLALLALNIGEGDEVIIPDLTFAATINSVLHARATPVIVDVEEDSWCIDPVEIEKAITPKTKAIIPVHVYGQPCDMDKIMALAKKHKLKVIEDAAEAHGAEYKGKKVGSFGDIACFSFFANKIITTGEGGMCLTNDDLLNDRIRVLRDHGMNKQKKYWHDEVGYNYRMTNLQAAIGCGQLERIDQILESRNEIENKYKSILEEEKMITFQNELKNQKKVVWMVSVLSQKKNEIMHLLKESNLDARPFFYPLSSMPLYAKYAHKMSVSISLSERGFNLPTIENIDWPKLKDIFCKV